MNNLVMNSVNKITPFTRFTPDALKKLTDDEILEGFKKDNRQITERYFFGYCEIAYKRWDKTYSLKNKDGLDSVTLSTNYYVDLSRKAWKPLEVDRQEASLCTWMVHGYWYKVQDALKTYKKERSVVWGSIEELQVVDKPDHKMPSIDLQIDIEKICSYMKDPVDQEILRKYILEGYQMTEIAKQLDLTVSAVSQRYKKIKMVYIIPYYFNDEK